jgi:5-methylcytosine-specific restriction protein A
MARTEGQSNPPWTRDEIILALDLFFEQGMVALPDSHPKVIALSELLRGLPGNERWAANPKFRNPAGVSFKLANLLNIATGRGFPNGSSADRSVWSRFERRPQQVKYVAALILQYVAETPLSSDGPDEDEEFTEGQVFTRIHRRIERNRKLRKKLISERQSKNILRCDACFATNPTSDPRLNDAIFDVHHLIPLSSQGSTVTKLSDLALLCANCHRIIHRLIATSGRWPTVDDVRNKLGS